jgi:Rps23 Pro-64 3,4-dihydroxylase Tpa1-like proline 4-hydroxylase
LEDSSFRQFIVEVTAEDTFNFMSPQATYFERGCFLRTHNDFHSVNGVQTRKVAFVFGFTKGWDADWGGTFHVLDEAGDIIDSQRPGFNTLILFKVPTIHYVSPVAHYAASRRYAISGWFLHNPQAMGK